MQRRTGGSHHRHLQCTAMDVDALTYAEMHNVVTEEMQINEQLHHEVAKLQAGQKLLQLKNYELLLEAKSFQ